MSEPDPKTTLRELREYFARSYEPQNKLAARIGVTPSPVAPRKMNDPIGQRRSAAPGQNHLPRPKIQS